MVLNFFCHLLPLNLFVLDAERSCIPVWIVVLSTLQGFALLVSQASTKLELLRDAPQQKALTGAQASSRQQLESTAPM
jgi:hypothetical protein